MKNKLKEMLLQHKPITEQTTDIDDIWGETVADGTEDFEEIPEDGTPQEAPIEDETVVDVPEEVEDAEVEDGEVVPAEVEDAEVEEDVEDVPEEENSHTIADAIEEAFLIPKSIRMKHNLRKVNKHAKKADALKTKMDQFQKDNLEVAKTISKEQKANFDKTNQAHIETEKGTLARSVKNMNQAASKYEDLFTKKNSKKIDKFLDNPKYRNKMVLKNKLAKTGNPELFKAKADERLKQRAEAETAEKVQAETKAKEVAAKEKVATPAVDNTSKAQKAINRQKEVLKKTKSLLAK